MANAVKNRNYFKNISASTKNVRNVYYFRFQNFCITEQWFYCDKWATYFIFGGKKNNALRNFFWFNPEPSKTLFKTGQLVELLKDGESKMAWDKDENVSWYRKFCNVQPKCSFFRKRKTPKNLFPILDILLVFSACWPAGQTPLITGQEVMVSSSDRSSLSLLPSSQAISCSTHSLSPAQIVYHDCLNQLSLSLYLEHQTQEAFSNLHMRTPFTFGHHFWAGSCNFVKPHNPHIFILVCDCLMSIS